MTLSPEKLGAVFLSCVAAYAAILIYTRLAGLRSFSKMSASDFAMTVAVGSLFASTAVSPEKQLAPGLVALATLFAGQRLIAEARGKSRWISKMLDNQPILLMLQGDIIDANLDRANVTHADLLGKLREANVCHIDQVLAVVFETTGDISVLHSGDLDELDPFLLEGVQRGDLKSPSDQ